jgi:hypothetical protein
MLASATCSSLLGTGVERSASLLRETTIYLLDLPQHDPRSRNGRPIHYTTALRWAQRGIRGVRLEAVRLGHRWVTSLEALDRFAARLAGITPNSDGINASS